MGRGKPGGGLDCQGLVTSHLALVSYRTRSCFFGGRGLGPSLGAFPFLGAEYLLMGAQEDEERKQTGARQRRDGQGLRPLTHL